MLPQKGERSFKIGVIVQVIPLEEEPRHHARTTRQCLTLEDLELLKRPVSCLAEVHDGSTGELFQGYCGRLLIRKSGTEPVIRIMAEGEDEALIGGVVDSIADAIAQAMQ